MTQIQLAVVYGLPFVILMVFLFFVYQMAYASGYDAGMHKMAEFNSKLTQDFLKGYPEVRQAYFEYCLKSCGYAEQRSNWIAHRMFKGADKSEIERLLGRKI